MSNRNEYHFSLKHVSREQRLVITIVAVCCIVIQFLTLNAIKLDKQRRSQSRAKIYGENISSYIKMNIDKVTSTTNTLKYLYNEYDNGFFYDFDKIASHLKSEDNAIGGIYFATNGIIDYAYPPEVAESTIGFNMMADPIQGERARLAYATRSVTVAGPHELIEGGRGFILRNPIFKGDKFIGFVIIILDWDKFIEKGLSAINNEYDFKLGIWKEDKSPYLVDEYNYVYRNCNTDVSRLMDIPIEVPNDVWHLCLEPEEGWINYVNMIHIVAISVCIFLLIMGLVIFWQIHSAKTLFTMEHDVLTGLFTRSAFYRRAKKILKEYPDKQFDVIVADVENFKAINGIYGTKKCDELLCYLADCYANEHELSACGRYGGDQFVVIFPSEERQSREEFEERARQIISNSPIEKINIKYGFYSDIDRTVPMNLIADRALLAARSILHNYDEVIANYDGPISKRHMKEQMLESLFEQAIANGDFKVWYQPKFDANTEKVVGLEALVRWYKEDGTPVSPADFIYIFEDDGLIVHLDEYVFRKVCNDIKEFYDKGVNIIPVSINISRASLHHAGIIRNYIDILNKAGIPMESVSLELTESTAFSNIQMKTLAENLKQSGFKLDMDDFGTGSSSLASLNLLPFDVIKIDKSLIDFIGTPDGEELVRHTIELAHFKNLKVVAEGVEDIKQLEFLRSKDCDIIQGYYYSKPLPHDECVEYLKKLYNEDRFQGIVS